MRVEQKRERKWKDLRDKHQQKEAKKIKSRRRKKLREEAEEFNEMKKDEGEGGGNLSSYPQTSAPWRLVPRVKVGRKRSKLAESLDQDFQRLIEEYRLNDKDHNTSPLWIWFYKLDEENCQCLICHVQFKQYRSTGSMMQHLERKHDEIMDNLGPGLNPWRVTEELLELKQLRREENMKKGRNRGPLPRLMGRKLEMERKKKEKMLEKEGKRWGKEMERLSHEGMDCKRNEGSSMARSVEDSLQEAEMEAEVDEELEEGLESDADQKSSNAVADDLEHVNGSLDFEDEPSLDEFGEEL